jgi:hypothetical protein
MRKLAFLSTSLLAGMISTPLAHAVDVKMYGQVNKAALMYNDGENTDFGVYDNDLSSTRFGVKGEQKLDNGMTASVLLEMEMQSNPTNAFVQNGAAGNSSTPLNTNAAGSTTGDVGLTERHASVGLAGDFGGIVAGQTTAATDGVLTQDLTGAQDVMNADVQKIGGGLNLRTAAGGLSGVTINGMTSNVATKRNDGIRYDSPKLMALGGSFQGKASVMQGGDVDAALLYEGKVADLKLKAAAGVEFNNDLASAPTGVAYDTRYAASASAQHKSGIGGTVAYTTDKRRSGVAGSDPEQWYAKVGYAWENYEVAADYGQSENYGVVGATPADSELTVMGLGAQYNMGNGVSVAGLYRNFDAERTGAALQDIDLYGVNMRVKF